MNILAKIVGWITHKGRKQHARDHPPTQRPHLTPHGNTLPDCIHEIVDLSWMPIDGRLIVVGDVHGCLDQLKMLLNKVSYAHHKDCLVFAGDLVNKGPNSCGVIDLAMTYGAISVRGNHDDSALFAYRSLPSNPNPFFHYSWVKDMSEKQARYLDAMPFTITIPKLNILIAHAGIVPGIPLQQQKLADLYKMRFLRKTDSKWEALETEQGSCVQWANVWKGPQHVIFGHDAMRRLQLKCYATGLDTGCVYGDGLAACVIPAGKLMHQLRERSRSCHCPFDPTTANLEVKVVIVPGNRRP